MLPQIVCVSGGISSSSPPVSARRVEVNILLLLLGALVGVLAVFGWHGGLVLSASAAQIAR